MCAIKFPALYGVHNAHCTPLAIPLAAKIMRTFANSNAQFIAGNSNNGITVRLRLEAIENEIFFYFVQCRRWIAETFLHRRKLFWCTRPMVNANCKKKKYINKNRIVEKLQLEKKKMRGRKIQIWKIQQNKKEENYNTCTHERVRIARAREMHSTWPMPFLFDWEHSGDAQLTHTHQHITKHNNIQLIPFRRCEKCVCSHAARARSNSFVRHRHCCRHCCRQLLAAC